MRISACLIAAIVSVIGAFQSRHVQVVPTPDQREKNQSRSNPAELFDDSYWTRGRQQENALRLMSLPHGFTPNSGADIAERLHDTTTNAVAYVPVVELLTDALLSVIKGEATKLSLLESGVAYPNVTNLLEGTHVEARPLRRLGSGLALMSKVNPSTAQALLGELYGELDELRFSAPDVDSRSGIESYLDRMMSLPSIHADRRIAAGILRRLSATKPLGLGIPPGPHRDSYFQYLRRNCKGDADVIACLQSWAEDKSSPLFDEVRLRMTLDFITRRGEVKIETPVAALFSSMAASDKTPAELQIIVLQLLSQPNGIPPRDDREAMETFEAVRADPVTYVPAIETIAAGLSLIIEGMDSDGALASVGIADAQWERKRTLREELHWPHSPSANPFARLRSAVKLLKIVNPPSGYDLAGRAYVDVYRGLARKTYDANNEILLRQTLDFLLTSLDDVCDRRVVQLIMLDLPAADDAAREKYFAYLAKACVGEQDVIERLRGWQEDEESPLRDDPRLTAALEAITPKEELQRQVLKLLTADDGTRREADDLPALEAEVRSNPAKYAPVAEMYGKLLLWSLNQEAYDERLIKLGFAKSIINDLKSSVRIKTDRLVMLGRTIALLRDVDAKAGDALAAEAFLWVDLLLKWEKAAQRQQWLRGFVNETLDGIADPNPRVTRIVVARLPEIDEPDRGPYFGYLKRTSRGDESVREQLRAWQADESSPLHGDPLLISTLEAIEAP